MYTRFDSTTHWKTQRSEDRIKDMETSHLMNTFLMFVKKPERTLSMLVHDIEATQDVFCPRGCTKEVRRRSIHNATSMTREELVTFALQSPLGMAICDELESRGVNVSNLLEINQEGEQNNAARA